MKKQDLYKFIDEKIHAKKTEINRKQAEISKRIIGEIKEEVSGLDNVAATASRLTDTLEKAKAEHSEAFDWSLSSRIRDAHYVINFKDALVNNIFDRVVAAYLAKDRAAEQQILKEKYPATFEVVQSLKNQYRRLSDESASLLTLKEELDAVVRSTRSAKDGYKNLAALGVDMSGFEESVQTLPAVQKLSVDVCIINGDCQ